MFKNYLKIAYRNIINDTSGLVAFTQIAGSKETHCSGAGCLSSGFFLGCSVM